MKKSFCDCCASEITSENTGCCGERIAVTVADVKFHMIPAGKGGPTPQDYDVCKYCLIDAVLKLDDRPKTNA